MSKHQPIQPAPPRRLFSRRRVLSSAAAAITAPIVLGSASPATALIFGGNLKNRLNDLNDKGEVATATVSVESEAAVRKALSWLKKAQNQDGSLGVDVGSNSDIGCTSMAGLAMLAHGSTTLVGVNRGHLVRMRKFILRTVDAMPAADITNATGTQLQNKIGRHGHSFFAALFLSQLMGEGSEYSVVLRALKRVVDVITRAQLSNGDWGQESWAPTLGTVMGWVSLRAAGLAGLAVGTAPEKTAEHLIEKMKQGMQANQGWMHNLYKNATGIRVFYEMGMEDTAIAKTALQEVLHLVTKDNTPFTQAGGEEFLAFHLITETMLQTGGKEWNTWFPVVRDKLVAVQNRDGSWTGHHCITSRTFCTAAAVLVLTSPYRYLPISQG